MATCLVALVTTGLAFGVLSYYSNRRNALQDLTGLAEAISHNSEAALTFGIEEDAQRILHMLHTRSSVSSAYLYDAEGAVFAAYIPEGSTPSAYVPPMATAGHSFEKHCLRVYYPVAVQQQALGMVCIEDSLQGVRDATRRSALTLVIVLLGALLLALLAATRLQSLISTPVLALARTARRVSTDSDYSRRADSGGSDEIQSLNAAFNEMLGVIQQRDRDLSNEIAVRCKAEDELRRHRDHLESIVAARTVELERANEDLRKEVGEHERAERLLRRTLSDLETTNSELERFAQVAAHDLQEPLRKMLAFSDRLCSTDESALDDQARDYLTRIMQSARQMQFLINDLLDFSRLARRKPVLRSVNLARVAENVLKELEQEIKAEAATISIGTLPTIEAEQPQMRQMLRHLISNAIKFRRAEIPPHVDIQAQENDDDTVTLSVKDNGMGFEQKYEARIFEIFQRLHARHVYEGTGIGLAICKRIVDVHGGRISVQSTPEEGATFTITLPRTHKFDREL
ncbi:MAG: HAMP domain-containing protein [Verrucomicrobia bacterium]|nr:HAMP domain-containing protein [Verrucomicrobiota bacterium]